MLEITKLEDGDYNVGTCLFSTGIMLDFIYEAYRE